MLGNRGLDPKSADVSGNTPVDINGPWIHAYVPVLYFRLQSGRGGKGALLLTAFSTSLRGLASPKLLRLGCRVRNNPGSGLQPIQRRARLAPRQARI